MSAQDPSAEAKPDLELEIAHLLLIDVVGYSRLLVNEQIELVQELNRIVRSTAAFRAAEANGELIRLPTGDGMALIFFRSPEEPARCALEVSRALKDHTHLHVRMGVHSGPVNQTTDVNDQINIAGAGINVARRIMDCADAGHILMSKHLADDLTQYRHWQPYLHDLGECEVKHGLRLNVVNLYKDGLGNPTLPEKFKPGKRWKQAPKVVARPAASSRWFNIGVLVALFFSVVALALILLISTRRAKTPSAAEPFSNPVSERSIAVLPFENLSNDKENAYFTDGVHDEILNNLAKVADLKVISRTSVRQYKEAPRSLRDIARALGVSHIVEGTVQRTGDRVRVSAQLIDARTDLHVWGEHYDRNVADVFAIESELAQQIVWTLKAKLLPHEKAAIQEQPTQDLAAYDLYLRAKDLVGGIAFTSAAKDNLLQAAQLLDTAVARDPSFLLAYYYLARTHDLLYFVGGDHTPARLALADRAIQTMQRLNPRAGQTHLALAQHFYWGQRDYDRARQELALATQALPNDPLPLLLSGLIDRRQGRWEDSAHQLEHALELDPRNVSILQPLSFDYQYLRRFKEMAAALDRVRAITPNDITAQAQRALVDLLWRGDPRPLHAAIQNVVSKHPAASASISIYWLYLALCERDNSAIKQALAVLPGDGCRDDAIPFPREWCEGVAYRSDGNETAARTAFMRAQSVAEGIVREQPDYAEEVCVLGLIHAALGKKSEALREGRHAMELLPLSKDSLNGAKLMGYVALIYAWTGEKKLAFEQLNKLARMPSDLSYGELKLHPYWDSLRSDDRFEKILASVSLDTKKEEKD